MPFVILPRAAFVCSLGIAEEARTNAFNDPCEQVTSALTGRPVPEGPLLTPAEARRETHWRANGESAVTTPAVAGYRTRAATT
jgi:crotonobetainyl-CoA:carnitine CoA-transferase CaiB-like acyl-CoA transferase